MQIVIRVDDVPNNLGDVRVEIDALDQPQPLSGWSDDQVREMVQGLLVQGNERIMAAYGLKTPLFNH